MKPFRLAWLSLWRRKIPSFITVLSIGISVACSGILLRLNHVSKDRFSTLGHGGDAIVGAKAGGLEILLGALNGEGEYPGYLPYVLFESMKTELIMGQEGKAPHSYLRSVIPFLYFAKHKGFRVIGTDENFLNRPSSNDSLKISEGRWSGFKNEAVLGSEVALQAGLKIDDEVSAEIWPGESEKTVSLKVVGILKPTFSAWDRMIYSTVETGQEALAQIDLSSYSNWQNKVLNYFLIYLEPRGFQPLFSLINRKTVGQAILVEKEKAKLELLTGTGMKLGLFVSIFILLLAGLSVASMLITRFDAMALQLAVLRAIGNRKGTIAKWLLWEGFLIGVVACLIGIVLDLVGFPMVRGLLGEALPPTELVPSSIFSSFPIWITALLATTTSVFIPLYRVYKQDVHFSLRN